MTKSISKKHGYPDIESYKENRNKKICDMYQNNMMICEIAKELSIERHTVTRVLKKNNLYDVRRNKAHLNSEKIKRNEKIIQLYQSGFSFRKIAKIMGVGHSTVEYIIKTFLKKSPVQYSMNIDNKENFIRHRKYEFDFDYFENIDTEEKAYWLGFLYADGCVTPNTIRVELQASDKKHIERFKDAIRADTKKLHYREEVNSYQIYLNSKKMSEDLTKQGCMQNKTFKLYFPTEQQVPQKLIHHFMRGYFDGDGCIYVRNKCSGVNMFCLVGNDHFIPIYKEKLFEGIKKTADVKYRTCPTNAHIISLYLGGNKQIEKIYNFLYNDATIYLERKKEKFETIIGRPHSTSIGE